MNGQVEIQMESGSAPEEANPTMHPDAMQQEDDDDDIIKMGDTVIFEVNGYQQVNFVKMRKGLYV